ncbi:hypothetical protein GCM10010400_19210 [Streptomyces aculeolatus]
MVGGGPSDLPALAAQRQAQPAQVAQPLLGQAFRQPAAARTNNAEHAFPLPQSTRRVEDEATRGAVRGWWHPVTLRGLPAKCVM